MTHTGNDLGLFGADAPYDYGEQPGGRAERRRRNQRRRRKRRFLGPVLAVLLIVGIIGGVVVGGRQILDRVTTVQDYTGSGTGQAVVRVQAGDSATAIATALVKAGVV